MSFNSQNRAVFYSENTSRWQRFRGTGLVLAIVASIFAAVFIVSVLINPFLPQLQLKPLAALPQTKDVIPTAPEKPMTERELNIKNIGKDAKAEKIKRQQLTDEKANRALSANILPIEQLQNKGRPLSIGFYVNWDDSSYTSLKQNLNELDWVVPEWIRLSGDENNPLILDVDEKALKLVQENKPNMPLVPLVQNYKNEEWNSEIIAKTIATDDSRQKFINALLETVAKNKFGGLTIDLEEIPASSQMNLFKFIQSLHAEFQKRGLILAQAVPFDNSDWNYKAYANVTDYLMLMAYDQHWATSEPGAIAGQDWFDATLKKRMAELSPAKTVVCFGNYAYNWTQGAKEAEDITFQQAVLTAKESLDSPNDIKFDRATKNPHFSYTEDDGKNHTIWFLDATTAFNELQSAKSYGAAGFALWRLGSEDPSLWSIFGASKTNNSISPNVLQTIKYGYDVDFEGTGEILQVKAQPQDGERDFKIENEQITDEVYQTIPSSYVMQRTGDRPGMIALTFDDGPDAVWTPKILDILKQENVQAAFFIVGENGQSNPGLVKRIVDEGHEIGNHTFTHPNLGEVSHRITDLEINATERLIESLTGRSTRLFRAPYFGDAEPRTPDEVEPTVQAQNLGYITVGLHLDPDDWKLQNDDGSKRTADDLVKETLDAAAITTPEERGQIVLLHDGGGDRSATVEALPKIIHELRNRGFQFTSLANLANMSRDEAMPPIPQNTNFLTRADSITFYAISTGGWLMKWIFLIGIVLGLSRQLIIGSLAFSQWLRSRNRDLTYAGEDYKPFVSVVVPAYNEDKIICRTIASLLASDYQHFEIIVVDDGSPDDTLKIVRENFSGNQQVTIFTKENGGKAEALNFGWRRATGEIIIGLDADTLFTKGTITALVRRFADERIGAVAGNAKVGNRINIVTKWQALEYVTSQNLDRRAFASLNCVTVVPGSVGAWRREVLEEIDGFSSDTLAEDQDSTIQVRKLGYKIGYEENAIAWTEAPDSLRGLAKQRFRWSYGTLQCMWKHKKALLNPKYGTLGFVAMPNVWIFQVIFPLISPLMDLMFIWSFASAFITWREHGKEYSPANLEAVMYYYALFLAVDWLGAFFAFLMEKGEQKSLLGWLFFQRFGYRQVMYQVMCKSVLRAIRGTIVDWNKIERKATVEAQHS